MNMRIESKNTRFLKIEKLSDIVGYHTPEHYRAQKTMKFVFFIGCIEGALIAGFCMWGYLSVV